MTAGMMCFMLANLWGLASLIMRTKGRQTFCTLLCLFFLIAGAGL